MILAVFLLVISMVMDKALGEESFGGGDIKLLFAVCLNFTPVQAMLMMVLCSLTGILFVVVLKKRKIAFGPFICMASMIFLLWGSQIADLYMGLMR